MNKLKHLLSPIKVLNTELANRAVMAAMGANMANEDGTVSDALLAYIGRRAKSGAGLIISGVAAVHPTGSASTNQMGAYEDRFVPGLKKYADAVHQAGEKAALQLHHAGRESIFMLLEGKAIGPSAVPSLVYRRPPNEMTPDDIHEIVESFGQAARRAREAGFDAVELHGAHGYLLTQFLSPLANQRDDEYGGSPANRARFVIEVLRSARANVGDDFPVLLRLSVEECIQGGYGVDDMQTILPDLVDAGADMIHASLGTHGTPGGIQIAPPEYEVGFNLWRARKVKEVVDVPVIGVGRFTDPRPADEAIARGEADMIAFGRQHLADPEFLKKAEQGRIEDIRICIGCNQGCIERLMFEPGSSVRCAINPETGQEQIYPQGPAPESRKVWVVGAGPAGLTAAQEAARLGHEVTLFEEDEDAGGQIFYASKAPYKDVYGEWIQWLISQVEASGVDLRRGARVTEASLNGEKPDVVLLAAGATGILPNISGIDRPLVCDAFQILGGEVAPGGNVVVVGGGMIGMETADFLLDKGSKVTVVELQPRSPVSKLASHGYMLHKRLREGGGLLLLGTKVEGIGEDSVTVVGEESGQEKLPADQVVIAVGTKPREELKKALEEKSITYSIVGDANQPRRIIEAVDEGAKAAWEIGVA